MGEAFDHPSRPREGGSCPVSPQQVEHLGGVHRMADRGRGGGSWRLSRSRRAGRRSRPCPVAGPRSRAGPGSLVLVVLLAGRPRPLLARRSATHRRALRAWTCMRRRLSRRARMRGGRPARPYRQTPGVAQNTTLRSSASPAAATTSSWPCSNPNRLTNPRNYPTRLDNKTGTPPFPSWSGARPSPPRARRRRGRLTGSSSVRTSSRPAASPTACGSRGEVLL